MVVIAPDSDGVLWLATFNGGLNRFDPETERFTAYHSDADNPAAGTFTHYGEAEGLLNETIYAILSDDHGRIWLTEQPVRL